MTQLSRSVLGSLVAGIAALTLAAPAQAAPQFLDGQIQNGIPINGCGSGSPEFEVGAFVSEYVDQNIPSPVIGEIFDVKITVAAIGNSCAGTAANIEFALPPGVTPAITSQVGIRCRIGPIGNMQPVGAECPDDVDPGFFTNTLAGPWYGLIPDDPNFPAWPLAQGSAVEIFVPVRSNRILSGIGDTSGCVCVIGSVKTSNGEVHPEFNFDWPQSSPNTGPYLNMFVFKGGPATYRLPKKVKGKKAKKRGIPIQVNATAGAVKHKATLKDKRGKTLGKGKLNATEPASETLVVKLNKKGKKAAKKGLKKGKLSVASSGAGAKSSAKKGKIKLT